MIRPPPRPRKPPESSSSTSCAGSPGPELDGLRPADDLRETLGLDSLDFRNLVVGVSERTGRRIEEDDYEGLVDLAGWIPLLAGP
ncbi:acyl carrier protein [Pseudonocardia sp. NPDC049154]|uniref:acyl carrier protein n=1 Tax=Pseudonocardia sp. NPDC049154 TaxID=3155501 RepID=UPI0033E3D644